MLLAKWRPRGPEPWKANGETSGQRPMCDPGFDFRAAYSAKSQLHLCEGRALGGALFAATQDVDKWRRGGAKGWGHGQDREARCVVRSSAPALPMQRVRYEAILEPLERVLALCHELDLDDEVAASRFQKYRERHPWLIELSRHGGWWRPNVLYGYCEHQFAGWM